MINGYEEGFRALNSGEYRRAVELLERAAAETSLTSDVVNHAYTLALFRANENARLADVAFRIALSQVDENPPAAMDYFQRAVQAGLAPELQREIGEIYETWRVERSPSPITGQITQAGHLVSSVVPEHPQTAYIRMLVDSLERQGVESAIFTTESTSSWFWNPSTAPITEDRLPGATVASTDGDFVRRAERIGETIRQSGIPIVFFHADLSDQIAARVAAMGVAPFQVNVAHDSVMNANLFDGFVHLSQNGALRSRFKSYPQQWVPPSSDIESRIASIAFESRESLAIDPASTVSASFSGPTRAQSNFVNAIVEILKRFPRHFHFFAGPADVRAFRGLLHGEGVLPRVRFLGSTGNTTPMLRAVDVYLAPFPETGRTSVLDMMSSGKPVVAMRFSDNSEFNTAAELVGEQELTPRTPAEYIQVADQLIRHPQERKRLGERLQERFRKEFNSDLLGVRYMEFIENLLNSRGSRRN